jgi:hypothetical protein
LERGDVAIEGASNDFVVGLSTDLEFFKFHYYKECILICS